MFVCFSLSYGTPRPAGRPVIRRWFRLFRHGVNHWTGDTLTVHCRGALYTVKQIPCSGLTDMHMNEFASFFRNAMMFLCRYQVRQCPGIPSMRLTSEGGRMKPWHSFLIRWLITWTARLQFRLSCTLMSSLAMITPFFPEVTEK